MKLGRKALLLAAIVSAFSVNSVSAHHNSFSTPSVSGSNTFFITNYNPDGGGFLASTSLTVGARYYYNASTLKYWVDASAQTVKGTFDKCGGNIAAGGTATVDSSSITLGNTSQYIYDPNYPVVGRHSNEISASSSYDLYNSNVTVSGTYTPNLTMCLGGGTKSYTLSVVR